MKYAHNKVQSAGNMNTVYFNPYWHLGFFCLLTGSFFNILALAFGDQILFSVTSCFSIVLNTLFSVLLLRESLVLTDFLAICLICVGATLFLLTAKQDDGEYTSDQLYNNYTRPISLIFLASAMGFISLLLITYRILWKKIEVYYLTQVNIVAG